MMAHLSSQEPHPSNTATASTYEQFYSYEDHISDLRDMLQKQWNSQQNCDLVIWCKGVPNKISLHACVAACFSPKISTHLSMASKKGSLRADFHFPVVRELVSFMYSGMMRVTFCNAKELLDCAEWFGLTAAVKFIEDFMRTCPPTQAGYMAFKRDTDPEYSLTRGQLSSFNDLLRENSMYTAADINTAMLVRTAAAEIGFDCIQREFGVAGLIQSSLVRAQGETMVFPGNDREPEQVVGEVVFPEFSSTRMSQNKVQENNCASSFCVTPRGSETCDTFTNGRQKTNNTDTAQLDVTIGSISMAENETNTRACSHACNLCDHTSSSTSRQAPHDHSDDVYLKYKCSRCPERFQSKKRRIKHFNAYHKNDFKCRHCGETFTWKTQLKQHSKEAHGDGRVFGCSLPGCKSMYETGDKLSVHKCNVHDAKLAVWCKNCGEMFTDKESYDSHNVSCIKSSADEEGRKEELEPSLKHKCSECSGYFISRHALHAHYTLAHLTYACEHCPQRFKQQGTLTRHILRCHKEPREFNCEFCEGVFKKPSEFKKHNLDLHKNDRPFLCVEPGCNARFSKLCNYHQHKENVHDGLRPIVCGTCGKSFSREVYMASHRYACVHTGQFLCQECGAVFNLKDSLRKHVSGVHRREGKYVCNNCGKRFNHPRNLYRHTLIHDNIYPYTCDQCGKKFRHTNTLKQHKERLHPQ